MTTHSTTKSDGQYTPAERAQFAEIRQQLRDAGLPRREAPDVCAAIQVAATFRRARALLGKQREIAHGVQPLPQGGD